MQMWQGTPPGEPSIFKTKTEARACWQKHREFMLRQHGGNGHRPYFWWLFECPFEFHFPRDLDREEALLFEHGLLGEQERVRLLKHWRHEFDHAQRCGFTYLTGNYKRLEGETAKRAYYKLAGIPKSLIEQWTGEQNRV
jgi:hypothetical protein